MLEPFPKRLAERRDGNHPREESAHGDDGDEHADHTRVEVHHRLTSLCFASSRSAKSMRSASSVTSCRTCCNSFRISSRSAGSMLGRRCSPAMRLATAAATGRRTQNVPPKNMKAATASGPLIERERPLLPASLPHRREPLRGPPLWDHAPRQNHPAGPLHSPL